MIVPLKFCLSQRRTARKSGTAATIQIPQTPTSIEKVAIHSSYDRSGRGVENVTPPFWESLENGKDVR
jgi:hypothetical protein